MYAKTCPPKKGRNANHNLWNNNGTWFAHYTVYPTRITKERVRCSLKTKCVVEARKRRDELLRRLAHAQEAAPPAAELSLAA